MVRLKTIIAVVLALTAFSGSALADCIRNGVELRGNWGQVRFAVEIADTRELRATGLMFRESMDRQTGMLFVYEHPQRAVFWMKNTLIPLDMIFLDRNGVVTSVHHDAVPGDLSPIDGGYGVYAVLEINGGLARDYGISEGSQMRHEIFSRSQPVWPC